MTKRLYVFLIAIIFLQFTATSQISSSVSSGCAPLVGVTFTCTPGAVNPLWNFGDGTTSPLANPTHTFSTPQTYTVTFTATGVSTQSLVIVVHGKPTPHFSATSVTKGCIPLPVTFVDNSTGGGGSAITTWQWAFGDGGTNTINSANQTYTYTLGGEFNVSVIVTDANGCDSSVTINNLVSVSQKPTITITPAFPSACLPPLTVTFAVSAISHVPPPQANTLTYLWNFSSAATSTLTNPPPQTYTSSGVFTQTVTVTDINGCSNSLTRNVIVQNPVAVFATADTVCLNAVFHPHGSTGGIETWTYGDGQTGPDSTHTYASPGTYHVLLTVANGTCFDTVNRIVYVEKAVAHFTINPSYMCSLPQVLSITNQSTPNTGTTFSQWTYFQTYTQYSVTPTISTLSNPTFTLTHLDTNRYTINQLDVKDSIHLIFTTSHGCKDTLRVLYMDTIFLPTARFMPDKYEGCVPLTVHFSDSSKVGPKEHITSWKYIFGDGASTTITSSPGNTVHTYTSTGIYYPTLIIQTQSGCGDTSYAIKIEVGRPPSASFSVSPTTVCIGDNVTLTNTTPATDSVDTWHYYGDGGYYASSCSDDANVTWPFSHATGTQNINMVACFRGCCSTTTNTPITVNGPLATFSTTMDCSTPHVYTFTGIISDAINWTWDFGDGNTVPNTTASTISHTYTTSGDYNVVLTASNTATGCGPSSYTVPIHVRDIKASFTYDTLLCSGTPHVFDASTSVDVNAYGSNGYIWFWDDGTHIDITSSSTITHTFTPTGTHTVTLIVKDINGCEDTLRKTIKAYTVVASFVPSKNPICVNSTVTFSNTSVSDTTITNYNWNFGDGGTSTQASPTYTYNITTPTINSVTVTLNVTTSLGCTATYTMAINISRPNASFAIASNKNICSGDSVKFTSTNSYPNMTWAYGDGTSIGPTPPQTITWHTYTASGSYITTLSVTDAAGCSDMKATTQTVSVQDFPVVSISSPDFGNTHLCYPHQSTYTDNTVLPTGVFLSRSWNLYDGSPTIGAPVVTTPTYTTPGTYSVTLTETTTNGCSASLTKTIIVYGPIGNFTLTPSIICKGQSITFGITDTSGVDSWNWDFGDGTIDTNSTSPISHTYNFHPPNATGTTFVTVNFKAGSCSHNAQNSVSIREVIADFKRNNELTKADTAHCLGTKDLFTNTSVGDDTYGWSFGNGATSNAMSPQYQYTVAGTYSVELYIANTASGCVDTIVKQMIIYPQFTVTATGDTICSGHIAQLTSSTASTYSWDIPPSSVVFSTIANPTVTPTTTTTYSLLASDINGCKDSVKALVYVIQPPNDTTWSTSIVIGQTVTLPGAQANSGYTYTWSPVSNLSCVNCATPVFNGTVDAHYVETIADVRGCFTGQSTFDIIVEPLSSMDVPTAFTPNGDGTNDIVYVGGWGLKSLNYFRIYNRWGELVFESTDLTVGWDGTYKGTPQNIETYVYQASANTYISTEPITKKGYIKLLR